MPCSRELFTTGVIRPCRKHANHGNQNLVTYFTVAANDTKTWVSLLCPICKEYVTTLTIEKAWNLLENKTVAQKIQYLPEYLQKWFWLTLPYRVKNEDLIKYFRGTKM